MPKLKPLQSLLRLVISLTILAMVIVLSALLSSWFVSRQLSELLQEEKAANQVTTRLDQPMVEMDFYKASGIPQQELSAFLREETTRQGKRAYPVMVTLQNESGDYLAECEVIVRWDAGEELVRVNRSGLIEFRLTSDKLRGLTLVVPSEFSHFRQRTIPLGPTYEPGEELETSQLVDDVIWDSRIRSHLTRELERLRAEGDVIPFEVVQTQLRRKECLLSLPESSAGQALSVADVFRQRRSSVVILGSMNADGAIRHATGCVLTSSGVIVTAYHVLVEPAVSRGVLTLDGKVYPVSEVLAASKPDDLAIIRIPAHDLQPAPLSKGDRVGSEVTVISHPGTAYFNLTHGFITRYSAGIEYGHLVVRMALTAEFARGSSGAPVFNSQGEVAGVVLATDTFGEQMVYRTAAPAGSIRKLLREPEE